MSKMTCNNLWMSLRCSYDNKISVRTFTLGRSSLFIGRLKSTLELKTFMSKRGEWGQPELSKILP